MRFVFLPKHQRLVNQCYPSGNTTDKKPKSSETSYLLYYVNSRRSKLEKVSSFLVKRTGSDLSRRRVGNISVTLELMNKIVNSCKENLNVFIKDFFSIMLTVLNNENFNNDYSIVDLLEVTFSSICTSVDDTLCNSDPDFIKNYSKFIDLFFKVVTTRIHKDELLLRLCEDISKTSSIASNPQLNHYIRKAVEFTLNKFQEEYPQYKVVSLDTPSEILNLNRRLSRVQTRNNGIDMNLPKNDNLTVQIIQSLFNTTETDKLNVSVRALLSHLQSTPNKELLTFICNKIPVHLRYIVILLGIRRLTYDKNAKDSEYDPITGLKLISCLLTSDVSIVGLSVLDVMKKILQFQLDNYDNHEITDQCCSTIRDLSCKNYYKGQTFDILYEFLIRLKGFKNDDGILKQNIVVRDVVEVLKYKNEPCITLELFVELSTFLKSSMVLALFNLVDNQPPSNLIMSQLYQTVSTLTEKNMQEIFMERIFAKYEHIALLSGLSYFLETTKEPNDIYYYYHLESANFLKLNDYKIQTEYKKEHSLLFSKADLLNYYSDIGSNKYSSKGSEILLLQKNNMSTVDLLDGPQQDPVEPLNSLAVIDKSGSDPPMVSQNTINAIKTRVSRDSIVPNKENIYRYVSDELRSWKTTKTNTPKISDLKSYIRHTGDKKIASSSSHKNLKSLRGSQSVKSRVTNITFLLKELQENSDQDEKIPDPDEEEIKGLDGIKMGQPRSIVLQNSLKIDKGTSFTGMHKAEIFSKIDSIENFEDAEEEIPKVDGRGKLFAST